MGPQLLVILSLMSNSFLPVSLSAVILGSEADFCSGAIYPSSDNSNVAADSAGIADVQNICDSSNSRETANTMVWASWYNFMRTGFMSL